MRWSRSIVTFGSSRLPSTAPASAAAIGYRRPASTVRRPRCRRPPASRATSRRRRSARRRPSRRSPPASPRTLRSRGRAARGRWRAARPGDPRTRRRSPTARPRAAATLGDASMLRSPGRSSNSAKPRISSPSTSSIVCTSICRPPSRQRNSTPPPAIRRSTSAPKNEAATAGSPNFNTTSRRAWSLSRRP